MCFLFYQANYHPQTKFGARLYFYTSLSFCSQGGHAWLLQGGMHGWGVHGCSWGCMVGGWCMFALGGMRGCSRGMHGCSGGVACVVALGGGSFGGCVVALGGMHGIRQDTEIRSMSRQYASYWNAFLFNSGSVS